MTSEKKKYTVEVRKIEVSRYEVEAWNPNQAKSEYATLAQEPLSRDTEELVSVKRNKPPKIEKPLGEIQESAPASSEKPEKKGKGNKK